jgi:hypothetical protein
MPMTKEERNAARRARYAEKKAAAPKPEPEPEAKPEAKPAMTAEEKKAKQKAYNKAYHAKKAALLTAEEKKERSAKVIAGRKGKEEERLEKERAKRAAGGAKTRARYMKQTPEELAAVGAERVKEQRALKGVKKPKKEYTPEELAEMIAKRNAANRERYHKKKAAEREKADAEAKARADAADMEAREREKETRAKVLTAGKAEATPAVRPLPPAEPEPAPRTTAPAQAVKETREAVTAADIGDISTSMSGILMPPAPKAADPKEEKRQKGIEELRLKWARREVGITPKTDGTYNELLKEVKKLKLRPDILYRPPPTWEEVVERVRANERVPTRYEAMELRRATEELERAEKQIKRGEAVDFAKREKAEAERKLGRARAMIAAGGGGGMLPLMTGFA